MIRDFDYYDHIILSCSGGKDSVACALLLHEYNVPADKVWLWHQSIDGRNETEHSFFDWPSTEGYVVKFSELMNMKLEFQWRAYGFYGEMFRNNSRTNDVYFTYKNDTIHLPTRGGNLSTRMKWPAKTASLNSRWCSGYLKIDVAARAITHHPELQGKRILFITGERREESHARSKYKEYEIHRSNSKNRLVHHWRIVIDRDERWIWDMFEKYGIIPHPAYFLGLPRLSCRTCIFYSKDHWCTIFDACPEVIYMLQETEEELGFTLDNKLTIREMVTAGRSLLLPENRKYIKLATSPFSSDISTNNWVLPAGAFGYGGGAI
nr:phosphoadenosine phosphosulfate reductase family protein [uncultured Draconibacterium sp.]